MTTLPRYDDVPYVPRAYPQTHPDVLARVARLHGIATPDPGRARILEVGCALGTNLGPIAVASPEAQCVGFDLSVEQIRRASAFAREVGVPNLSLRHAGISEVDASWGDFDYIIAHGIWSWVPPEVADQLLAMIRERLTPDGVAYVSYNAYPGWKQREVLRSMLLLHTEGIPSARKQAQAARAFLSVLETELASDLPEVDQAWLKHHARRVRGQPDGYLCHDYLSPHNRPMWFRDFVATAESAGLAYLADAQIATMLPSQVPKNPTMPLGEDPVRTEQYLDLLRQRSFRCSLLVHPHHAIDRSLSWRHATTLHFGSDGRIVEQDGQTVLVKGERSTRTTHPLLAAAFRVLVDAWPGVLPFDDLLERARRRSPAPPAEDDREVLARVLHTGSLQDFFDARASAIRAAPLSRRPTLSPWARAQLATGTLTTLRHQSTTPGDAVCQVLWACDGTRDEEAIVKALESRVDATDDEGRPLPRKVLRDALRQRVRAILPQAAQLSLFVA